MKNVPQFLVDRAKEFAKSTDHLIVTPFLPRIEKIYAKDESLLEKQNKNVILRLIDRSKEHARLLEVRTVHFLNGEFGDELYMFVSSPLFQEVKNVQRQC